MKKKKIVYSKKNELPFDQLDNWKDFEHLCVHLVSSIYAKHEVRSYLEQGNNQEGIDIYAYDSESKKYTTIQCKKCKSFTPAKIEESATLFLKGEFGQKSKEFILAASANLGTAKCEEEIQKTTRRLARKNIRFIVWDKKQLSLILKNYPQIVYDTFRSTDLVKLFNGEELLKKVVINKIAPKKLIYPKSTLYVQRRILSEDEEFKKSTNLPGVKKIETHLGKEVELRIGNQNPCRILLLSSAGVGKSTEFSHLAHQFSNSKSAIFPIKIELKDYTEENIEELLKIRCKNWKNIQISNLLLLFDGLDELDDNRFNYFLSKISGFLSGYPNCNIAISSRTNFIDVNFIKKNLLGFDIYYLDILGRPEIKLFEQLIKNKRPSLFWSNIKKNGFSEIALIPYYLIHLIEVYNEFGGENFPKSKTQLFELLLSRKLDHERIKNAKSSNGEIKNDIELAVIKISFTMSLLCRNSITDKEVKVLLGNNSRYISEKKEKVIKRLFLVDRVNPKDRLVSWSFYHNNFQEFLSAKVLSSLHLKRIKGILAPKGKKIHPKWVNTLSFLFDILDSNTDKFKKLLKWIVETEPEVLIRFEADKLSDELRFKIFRSVYQYYKKRGIYVRSENFNTAELAVFSSRSKKWIQFILKEIETNKTEEILVSLISLLSNSTDFLNEEKKIKRILWNIIESSAYNENVQELSIGCLTQLNLIHELDIKKIISNCPNWNTRAVRQALYRALSRLENSDEHVDFILDGIKILSEKNGDYIYNGDGIYLEQALLFVKREGGIRKICLYIQDNPQIVNSNKLGSEFYFDDLFIGKLIDNLVSLAKENPTKAFELGFILFTTIDSHELHGSYTSVFDFFIKTNTQLQFTQRAIKEKLITKIYFFKPLHFFNKESLDFIIDQYLNKGVEKGIINQTFHSLNSSDPGLFKYFYKEVNKKTSDEFKISRRDIVDYEGEHKKAVVNNQKLLLSRSKYLEELKKFRKRFPLSKNVTSDEIWKFRGEANQKKNVIYQSSIITDFSLLLAKEGNFNLPYINRLFSSQEKWDSYVCNEVKNVLKRGAIIIPGLKAFIVKWCTSKIRSANFSDFIKVNPDNSFTYRLLEYNLALFFVKLSLDYPKDKLLSMFVCDWSGIKKDSNISPGTELIADMLIDKINDLPKVKKQILENINRGSIMKLVLESHIRLLKELRIIEGRNHVFEALSGNILTNYDKVEVADIYLELGGTRESLCGLLPKKFGSELCSWDWYLLTNLEIYKPDEAKKLFKSYLSDIEIRLLDKIGFAEKLMRLGEIKGFEFIYKIIIAEKKLPKSWFSFPLEMLVNLPTKKSLKMLFEMLDLSLYIKHEESSRDFNSIENLCLQSLYCIGSANFDNMVLVKKSLQRFIKKRESQIPKVKSLHYNIKSIENAFFKTSFISIEQAKEISKSIDYRSVLSI